MLVLANYWYSPSTPCLPPPLLNGVNNFLFSLQAISPISPPLLFPLFSLLLSPQPLPPHISHLPLTLSAFSYKLLKYLYMYFFTSDEIKQKFYWTHIFVLVYCIGNPTWSIWWFYCHSFWWNSIQLFHGFAGNSQIIVPS